MNDKTNIPTLPHGEGTMKYRTDRGKIMYRKWYKGVRLSVLADTQKEAMQKMRQKEKEFDSNPKQATKEKGAPLKDVMDKWLNLYKINEVKQRTFDRIECTCKNQIYKYPIGNMQIDTIDSDIIQEHMNTIIKENYSFR